MVPAQTVSGTAWSACTAVGTACTNRVTGGFAYSEADTITGIPAGMNNAMFQSEWTGGATGTGVVAVGHGPSGSRCRSPTAPTRSDCTSPS